MPRILSHTPEWLSRPSPGFDMFTKPTDAEKKALETMEESSKRSPYRGSRKTIARRGTEVFVVVGNTIRWGDLPTIKDDFEAVDALSRTPSKNRGASKSIVNDFSDDPKYKTLKTSVHEQIHQLVPSPNEELLAIVTANTVHIAILPDTVHLGQPDTGPIRLRTHTLGPTIHVLSQSRITDVLWHPLGVSGQCLVTVTADAVVRVWELNKDNRGSYDNPTTALDLTKLLHATSSEDNVEPLRLGENKGFSADALGMEVASAAFGGSGLEGERGWASMTLWVAMTEGEVHTLCPLLPSKWQSPSSQVPSLSTSVVAKKAYAEGPDSHEELQRNFEAQFRWLSELDDQNPIPIGYYNPFDSEASIYNRPTSTGLHPQLQGPFRILPGDIEDDLELAALHVIAPRLGADEAFDPEDENYLNDPEESGLSATVVCLVSTSGRVHVCLSLEEVEGQWLPLKPPRTEYVHDPNNQPQLVLLEALDTLKTKEVSEFEQPVIVPDIHSRYSFFVAHSRGVWFLSIEEWARRLEKELQGEDTSGASFRMKRLGQTSQTLLERLMFFTDTMTPKSAKSVTAPVLFQDSYLGYFLLTAFESRPQAILLDNSHEVTTTSTASVPYSEVEEEQKQIMPPPPMPYEPAPVFWNHKSALTTFLDTHVHKRHKSLLKDEIRLSSATLEIMTEAHRVLSRETNTLGHAVGDLFSRCVLLQEKLRHQIAEANEAAARVDRMSGNDADDYGNGSDERGTARLKQRLLTAQQRQKDMNERHDALRKKLSNVTARALSNDEKSWVDQVDKMCNAFDPELGKEGQGPAKTKQKALRERRDEVKELAKRLGEEAKEANQEPEATSTSNGFKVPPDIRRYKVGQVTELMERQSALVDAAQERLERLSLLGA